MKMMFRSEIVAQRQQNREVHQVILRWKMQVCPFISFNFIYANFYVEHPRLWLLLNPLPRRLPHWPLKPISIPTMMSKFNLSIHQIASPGTNALAMWTTYSPHRLSKLVVKCFATAKNARKCHLIQFFILFVLSLLRKQYKKEVLIVAEATTLRRHLQANHKVLEPTFYWYQPY